jgi:aminopeptidase N
VLELLELVDSAKAFSLALSQYKNAPAMTDRLAALAVMLRVEPSQAAPALQHYRERYADNALAMDKWFAIQAQSTAANALDRVRTLESDPAFTLKNPNRVHALLGTFVRGNPSGFHRADGAGYQLLADRLIQLDALNPQLAARIATAFNGWQRLEPKRREAAHAAIAALAREENLSRNLTEIVDSVFRH